MLKNFAKIKLLISVTVVLTIVLSFVGIIYFFNNRICIGNYCNRAFLKVTNKFDGKVYQLCEKDDFKKYISKNSFCTDAFTTFQNYPVTWEYFQFDNFYIDYFETGDPGGWDDYPTYKFGFINGDINKKNSINPRKWKKEGSVYIFENRFYSKTTNKYETFKFIFNPNNFETTNEKSYDEFVSNEENYVDNNSYNKSNKSK